MKLSELENIKNKDYVVFLPSSDWDIKESVEYTFDSVIYIDYEPTIQDVQRTLTFINKNVKQVILFDFCPFFREIIHHIKKEKKVTWVFKNSIAMMTDGGVRATVSNIMEFTDRRIVDEIACIDYAAYQVFKELGFNAKHLILDVERKEEEEVNSNSIGLLGNDHDPNHNTYNQLSALRMVDYSKLKLVHIMPATKEFISFFDLKEEPVENIEEAMRENCVNLYINFTGNNFQVILKSMDLGIPCILGNTDLFDQYPVLKEYLIMDSDDDIPEIARRIENAKENREKIMKEYRKFRKEYSKLSKKSIKEILVSEV